MPDNSANTKRLAKNTMLLYFRMLLTMGISLYTSRVVLSVLGIEDYGIYNVVGGVVAMCGLLSGSLSAAISRFITFELGKGNLERLKTIFCTSINIQVILIVIITILLETIGIWFLNAKMVIPPERLRAANWVFQFSMVTFAVNLLSVPYNAVIIAHEKMSAFAYISIIDCMLKLIVAFIIAYNPFDRLVYYGLLIMIVGIVIRSTYAIYCKRHFEEATYGMIFDKGLMKEMFGFAGWNYFAQTAYILNTQGVNMLLNIFFGVTVNAARGVAVQVNSVVSNFVGNFMTAVKPQITKSYAVKDYDYCFKLVNKGAKYGFFLMFMMSLPILLETETILDLWLKTPPEDSANFVRWTILCSMTTSTGSTLLTLVMATGDIKKYQILITLCGFLPFPLTWISFEMGATVIWAYIFYFIVYYSLNYVRLWLVHSKTGIPCKPFIKEVMLKAHFVAAISFVIPFLIVKCYEPSILRLIITCIVSVVSCVCFIYFIGLNSLEKNMIKSKICTILKFKKLH